MFLKFQNLNRSGIIASCQFFINFLQSLNLVMTASWVEKLKQFRYIAYIIILLVNFQETISRFGLPMAMVGS